jgi:HEAT repeat protein
MRRRWLAGLCVAAVMLLTASAAWAAQPAQASAERSARELVADLDSVEAAVRARAACGLRDLGDRAADAIQSLVKLLADGSPVDGNVCPRRWWRGGANDMTSPGEQAAAALAAIGSRSFQPVLNALKSDAWIARRNAAWTLGALDDDRAVAALVEALRDREAPVRDQAAWALGAIDDAAAVPALLTSIKDADAKVRKHSAWALGAIDDARAVDALIGALGDQNADVREQAAWALGAVGDSRALNGLVGALKDSSAGVRRQAAWAIGAIGR